MNALFIKLDKVLKFTLKIILICTYIFWRFADRASQYIYLSN